MYTKIYISIFFLAWLALFVLGELTAAGVPTCMYLHAHMCWNAEVQSEKIVDLVVHHDDGGKEGSEVATQGLRDRERNTRLFLMMPLP